MIKTFIALSILIFLLLSASCAHLPERSDRGLSVKSTPRPFIPPTPAIQNRMILALRDEMTRLDGEGLIPRRNRPESFITTTNRLAQEALINENSFDFYRTFSRLDATYPNLHAHVNFPESLYREIWLPGYGNANRSNLVISTEFLSTQRTRTVLSEVTDDPLLSNQWTGAEVTAINGIVLKKWKDENFIFCKWALRTVCDRKLNENVLARLLPWKSGPLIYTVAKAGKTRDFSVNFNRPLSADETGYERRQCDWKWQKRYPNFKLVHRGYFACLFEKQDDPEVFLLRISSFQYERGNKVDPNSTIQTMRQETDALKAVWVPRSGSVRHLIVDLIDNGGGNEPMDYYRLLLRKPYQEQFVEFKKLPEMDVAENRKSIFWGDEAHEYWFQQQKRSGDWSRLKKGNFSKPTPMFCADSARSCDDAKFQPDSHEFSGKVSVMINDNCVSTCDGVVDLLSKELHAKLYGFYQAADTAYSRLRIDAVQDELQSKGFRLKVGPQRANFDENFLVSQGVAVSVSVDERGQVTAGKPHSLEKFVPSHWDRDYHQEVLEALLKDQKL